MVLRTTDENLGDDIPQSSESECSSVNSPDDSDTDSSSLSSSQSDSVDVDAFLGPESSFTSEPRLKTFKLVGDNLDKTVKPREMRVDHQTKSLHYFQVYALRDRVDLSDFSNEVKMPDIDSIKLDNFLPSSQDDNTMKSNFGVLVGRVLMKHIPYFKKFGHGLERHIMHEYSEEMSKKSEVVSVRLKVCYCFYTIDYGG